MNQVLVVEDDSIIRSLLRDVLESEGFDVTEAENGADALEKLAELSDPCVILSDLMMPVMDGFEFIRRMHQDQKYKEYPVVVISAASSERVSDLKSHRSDKMKFIPKPVDIDLLLKVLSKYCDDINQNAEHSKDADSQLHC